MHHHAHISQAVHQSRPGDAPVSLLTADEVERRVDVRARGGWSGFAQYSRHAGIAEERLRYIDVGGLVRPAEVRAQGAADEADSCQLEGGELKSLGATCKCVDGEP